MKKTETKINLSFQNLYKQQKNAITIPSKVEIRKVCKKILFSFLNTSEVFEKSVIKDFDFDKISFELVFTDDTQIQDINREYRKKDKPTDVITFALFADNEPKFVFDGEISLGEIIISIDTVQRQAQEIGNSFEYELYYILSHGILHLLGFDHLTEDDYNFMVKYQKESLKGNV